jgi:SAM-dependent methyltransferase
VGFPPEAAEAIPLEQVGHAGEGRERYGPSPYGTLGRALRRGDVGPDDVFIDFGCGMGRLLYEAAARFPFKRVIGVDIVPEFTSVAREVLARNAGRLRCKNVEVITADALAYVVPHDVTVAYFGAAFGPPILGGVLDRLVASADERPRVIRIVSYSATGQPEEFEEHPRIRLVRRGRRLIRRWSPAEHVALFEIRPG